SSTFISTCITRSSLEERTILAWPWQRSFSTAWPLSRKVIKLPIKKLIRCISTRMETTGRLL
ncbi:hypothetical protein KI387_020777, partial [Taxus chinensis]